jgi:hypothetical protein
LLSSSDLPAVARDGKLLVMHKSASLPDRCVSSGEKPDRVEEHTFAYPGQTWLSIGPFGGALGALLMVLFASALGEKFVIRVPESSGAQRWRWWLGALGVVMMVGGVAATSAFWLLNPRGSDLAVNGGLVSLLVAIFGFATWLDNLQPLRITKVAGDHLWLAGASEAYLNTLPEWSPATVRPEADSNIASPAGPA